MVEAKSPYKMRPPVMNVVVEDSMDIMIARDTTRRASSLLGFSPAFRAQIASAAATLADLVLKTGESHTINLNGVTNADVIGLQISSETSWLEGVSVKNVMIALKSKMGDLVDEIWLEEDPATIMMVIWLNDERK
ncbi:MAG: hypothetical protein AAF126_05560 [Chloroflexota bacterium]